MPLRFEVRTAELAGFSRGHRIVRLRAFDPMWRDDFAPESDVDLIVEFEPGTPVGLLTLAGLEIALS